VPGDLLHALFSNVTVALRQQMKFFRAIPCSRRNISLLEDKYSLLCLIGNFHIKPLIVLHNAVGDPARED
jgi:hypothetical protein